jgi:hypothetical protein
LIQTSKILIFEMVLRYQRFEYHISLDITSWYPNFSYMCPTLVVTFLTTNMDFFCLPTLCKFCLVALFKDWTTCPRTKCRMHEVDFGSTTKLTFLFDSYHANGTLWLRGGLGYQLSNLWFHLFWTISDVNWNTIKLKVPKR